MARSILSGGGIQSRQYVTSRSGVKVEPEAKAASAAGVAQQGLSTAFKKEPLFEGRGYTPKEMAPTGIANSRFNSACIWAWKWSNNLSERFAKPNSNGKANASWKG